MSALLVLASAVVVACTGRTLLRAAAARRRSARRERESVELLRALTGELAAGATPDQALGAVATMRPLPAVLVAALSVSSATGAPLADLLGRLASAATRAADDAREVGSVLAGPRTTAGLLAGLPALGMVLAAATGGRPAAFLLGAAPGRCCLLLGVTLDAAGLLWIERLARSSRP
jgi:tight adherence protein B